MITEWPISQGPQESVINLNHHLRKSALSTYLCHFIIFSQKRELGSPNWQSHTKFWLKKSWGNTHTKANLGKLRFLPKEIHLSKVRRQKCLRQCCSPEKWKQDLHRDTNQEGSTVQGDEREVIRCSDVGLVTSKPQVNLSKTLCLELDHWILKGGLTITNKNQVTTQGKKSNNKANIMKMTSQWKSYLNISTLKCKYLLINYNVIIWRWQTGRLRKKSTRIADTQNALNPFSQLVQLDIHPLTIRLKCKSGFPRLNSWL